MIKQKYKLQDEMARETNHLHTREAPRPRLFRGAWGRIEFWQLLPVRDAAADIEVHVHAMGIHRAIE